MSTALATRPARRLLRLFEREPFKALQEEFDDLVTRFSAEWDGQPREGEALIPSMDVSESDTAVEVRIDVPGMKREDINIELTGNHLRITGERKEAREEKGLTWYRSERRTGKFARSMTLPCAVKEKEVKAEYHEGVLTVQLPKAEEARAHKIAIKAT